MVNQDDNEASTGAGPSAAATSEKAMMVNKVSVKVPPFWPEHPEIWFAQVEAQFSVAGVSTDSSKFNTVVAAVESNVLAQISDAILNPPDNGKYDNLKRRIIDRYCESEQKKTQKLLSDVDLGDKRPTQLLSELSELAKNKVSTEFLKSLWLQRLPVQVRAILQASNADLPDLAKLADKILEVGDFQQVSVVAKGNAADETFSGISKRIERIEAQFDKLIQNTRYRPNRRSRSVSRGRDARANTPMRTKGELCWYQQVHGDNARKCRPPCERGQKATKN
ncbi:uncharacterized protein LOC118757038 [Rhagoletis pomonella]|uniref:uncharacterized protein LOC118757038 n=1 Tax=Rhagoletis pomonella TaxID=28610 RepID=UPI001782F54A|nr:uncharacterized protein LOC118757038 [Rhagoletis pomonella]